MKNGATVAAFERAFAEYVGARYAIALCNGTATLHTALAALGVGPGDRVAVPPLTMSATTIAVLHAGATPVFVDVDPETWLMEDRFDGESCAAAIPVSLYGLHSGYGANSGCPAVIDDAAQTLKPHAADPGPLAAPHFTSYSFQASKILPLGEGGMLVTNDEGLATRAREFSSLGYRMDPDQPRIAPEALKSPTRERHHSLGWNYRMSDLVAAEGLRKLDHADRLLDLRRYAASLYRQAIGEWRWITPQATPDGWTHDYWCYTVALRSPDLWAPFARAIVRHGGERPYAAWRLTYREPAFRHLAPDGTCPVAEDLQPRLMQCQTNDIRSAERNAEALANAIREIG